MTQKSYFHRTWKCFWTELNISSTSIIHGSLTPSPLSVRVLIITILPVTIKSTINKVVKKKGHCVLCGVNSNRFNIFGARLNVLMDEQRKSLTCKIANCLRSRIKGSFLPLTALWSNVFMCGSVFRSLVHARERRYSIGGTSVINKCHYCTFMCTSLEPQNAASTIHTCSVCASVITWSTC